MVELRSAAIALALLAACTSSAAAPPAATGDPASGRRVFAEGRTPDGGTLLGRIGADAIELRGATVACAGCHGAQGQGREGGESAPSIQGRVLFAPAPPGLEGRDARPAYDARSLARAIRDGRSANGRQLSWMMPRFALDDAALADLVAHLARLGQTPEVGVGGGRIVVGSALPQTGPLAALGADARAVIEAVFADVAAEGGIFGNRIELRVEDEARGDATARLLDAGVFALVGSLRAAPSASDARLEREGVPLVGPLGPAPAGAEVHPSIFWLFPGPAQQARWAVQQLARARPGARIAVAAGERASDRAWADAAADEAPRWQLPEVRRLAPRAPVPKGVDAVLFSGEAAELLGVAEKLPGGVDLVAPASLAVPAAARAARVRFVHPASAGDTDPAAFRAFLARHGIVERNVLFQAGAWVSARLLVESLRRAGAAPTRADLVRALESMRDFETGVLPPVTFGSHRRLGIAGARFVRLAPGSAEPVSASPWRSLVLR